MENFECGNKNLVTDAPIERSESRPTKISHREAMNRIRDYYGLPRRNYEEQNAAKDECDND